MINTKNKRKSLYLALDKLDIITKLKPLLEGGGYKLRLEDGKFVPRDPGASYQPPWVYVKTLGSARCDIFHQVFHQLFKHIPTYCRHCYKVVVRPQNLIQLFDLYELQREIGVPCKCGIEKRATVHGLYGGYFYTRSYKEGLERYEQVRKLVDEQLDKTTPVILKRYCTEFEIGPLSLGPSDEIPPTTDEEKEWEHHILSLFPPVGFATRQNDWQLAHVMREWIHWAYQNGDTTYKAFTDDSPLFESYVTYHNHGGET